MKTPKENIISTLTGKSMLFIENDNGLYNGLEDFEKILKSNGLKYDCLFRVDTIPLLEIVKKIDSNDGIIFQTQWMTKVSKLIKEYMFSLKEKKIIIEVPIYKPSFYYKPKGVPHDIYFFHAALTKWDEIEFKKITENAYWDYKNKFDK